MPRNATEDERPAETTSATGDQWVLGHGHQRAVVTEVGATLRSYTVGDRPVVDGFGADEWSSAGRGQVLAPWPNRLGDGRYEFDGVVAQVPLDEPERGNAIHGLVRWRPFAMIGRAQNRVSLTCVLHPSPAYPFTLGLTVEYRLGREGLVVTTDAENLGKEPLPFGLGFHPYVTVGTPSVNTVRVRIPADKRVVTDERGLPTGEASIAGTELDFSDGRMLGHTRLDTAFTGLERGGDGRARVELDSADSTAGLTLWMDDRFGYVMVFTADTLDPPARRRSMAVEPMTCPPDAFRSGKALTQLVPGARWTASWGLTPR